MTVLTFTGLGAWTPLALGNTLIAWYRADLGVYKDAGATLAANGDTVQQWNDQSGNGYTLSQGSAGNRPTYQTAGFNSNKTVLFSASGSTFMATSGSSVNLSGSTGSAFFVGQMLTGTNNFGRAISYVGASGGNDYNATSSAAWILRDGTNNGFATYRNSSEIAIQAISLATNYRLGMIFDGANATPYVNSVAGTPSANADAFTGPGTLTIGEDQGSGSRWSGAISEIVITNSALSTADRLNLDTWFKSQWGL